MWLVGMVVNFAVAGQPVFYYFSTIGGVLLSLGLLAAMTAIKLVGMAVMMVVAGGVTLLAGWLSNEYAPSNLDVDYYNHHTFHS